MGLTLYENGEFLTTAKTFDSIRYPTFADKYRTLTIGADDNPLKWKSGGEFEIGHLVVWTRKLTADLIDRKAFLTVVQQTLQSIMCCRRKSGKDIY